MTCKFFPYTEHEDYSVDMEKVTIPPGNLSVLFTTSILNDNVVEDTESFELVFTLELGEDVPESVKRGISICGNNSVPVQIIDDDGRYLEMIEHSEDSWL